MKNEVLKKIARRIKNGRGMLPGKQSEWTCIILANNPARDKQVGR